MAQQNVYVVGVGMTPFIKPRGKVDYPEMGFEAGVKALADAGITYDQVEQGVACYCYGDSTCGQRVFYQFGEFPRLLVARRWTGGLMAGG